MHVDLDQGTLHIRFTGDFGGSEAECLYEVVLSCAPLRELVLDFTEVTHFQDVAFVPLARTLSCQGGTKVTLHGLTRHQSRMLRYFGFEIGANALSPAHAAQ